MSESIVKGCMGYRIHTCGSWGEWMWGYSSSTTVDECAKHGRSVMERAYDPEDCGWAQWAIRTDDGEVIICWSDPLPEWLTALQPTLAG